MFRLGLVNFKFNINDRSGRERIMAKMEVMSSQRKYIRPDRCSYLSVPSDDP